MIRCPWHAWEFDLRDGPSWFDPARKRVRSYEVAVVGGGRLRRSRRGRGCCPGPYQPRDVRRCRSTASTWWSRSDELTVLAIRRSGPAAPTSRARAWRRTARSIRRAAQLAHRQLVAEVQRERAGVAVHHLQRVQAEGRPARRTRRRRGGWSRAARRLARCSALIDSSSARSVIARTPTRPPPRRAPTRVPRTARSPSRPACAG